MIEYSPHEIDLDLLHCAKQALHHLKKNDPKRPELTRLIHDYEVACTLNKGPSISRSKEWNIRALLTYNKLKKMELILYVTEQ